LARGQQGSKPAAATTSTAAAPTAASGGGTGSATSESEQEAERIEGEKRFHSNCGRCHQAPHKFPPRMMATIVRHMRVRATITDEDMRLILAFMTQ
jgi:mono/diheme cytochrome c family protein